MSDLIEIGMFFAVLLVARAIVWAVERWAGDRERRDSEQQRSE